MRKHLLFCMAFVASLAAKAGDIVLPGTASPILTLKAEVGTEVSIKPGVYAESDIFAVDFGDGVQVIDSVGHQNKGVCVDDGTDTWPQKEGTTHTGITEFKGTAAGDGTITVYGTSDLWYLAVTGALPTSFEQEKMKKVVQFTISKVAAESIDLKGFDDLKIFGFSQGSLKSINVKDNAALTNLTINNNTASAFESILESLDLSGNANLEQLNVMGASATKPGKLTSLDLSNNPKLTSVYAQYNALTSVTLPAGAALTFLNFQNNQIGSINLSSVASFKDTYLNNNKLTTVDLSKLVAGSNIYLDGNQLAEVSVPVSVKNLQLNNNKLTKVSIVNATASCKLENNLLTLATIPAQPASLNNSSKTKKFTYAPQAAMEVPAIVPANTELDLTSQLTVEKGELNPSGYTENLSGTTTYSFVTASGTPLVEGTDYEVTEPGKFKFLKEQTEKIHGEMLNTAFPKFTAAAPFKTTEFAVMAEPILTFKGTVGEETTLTFGAWDKEDTYGVDFGDGNLQIAKIGTDNKGPVQADGSTSSATKFTGTVAGDGTIKVYGVNDVWYLITTNGTMPTAFDQPKLMNVVQMSITGADVESVVLPAYEKMTQFTFNNSSVKSVDVSKVTGLTSLTINNYSASKLEPQLESIDLSKNVNLETINLQGNQNNYGKLKTLDLSANTKLKGMGLYVQYNQLESLTLPEAWAPDEVTETQTITYGLTAINVQNNKLTTLPWDKLKALKNLYAADNQLTTVNVSEMENLAWLDVKNNKLKGNLDLTANQKFTNVYVNGNQLTSVKVTDVTKQFYFDNNKMTYASMPALPAGMNTPTKKKQFHYAPQAPLPVEESLVNLDLSLQLTAKGIEAEEKTTSFSFVTASGKTLVEGTDYVMTALGEFQFLTEQTEKVHGVMANEGFPLFTGADAFVTTEFTVDLTQGIKDINAVGTAGKVYNLQGVEVAQPLKGLYIQNGKKVLVK